MPIPFTITNIVKSDISWWDYVVGGAQIAGVIGVLILIWQIVEMARQTKEMKNSIFCSVMNDQQQMTFEIGKMFVEKPDLLKYIYSDVKPPQQKSKKAEVEAAYMVMIDYFSYILDSLTLYEEFLDPRPWEDYIVDMIAGNKGLRTFYNEHKKWYGDEFNRVNLKVEKRLKELSINKKRINK